MPDLAKCAGQFNRNGEEKPAGQSRCSCRQTSRFDGTEVIAIKFYGLVAAGHSVALMAQIFSQIPLHLRGGFERHRGMHKARAANADHAVERPERL